MSFGLRLHHVGYAVREVAPVVAMYERVFGYRVRTGLIAVPSQTARVQFMQLPGERSYAEFVMPDGPGSKLTRVAERGGGPHHLCYTAGPLEGEIARMEEAGMKLIGDPAPSEAFAGRRVCWLFGADGQPVELVERRGDEDACEPGEVTASGETR